MEAERTVPHWMARTTRLAAQLYDRWAHGTPEDIAALVAEAEGEELPHVVCGLLYVGENLAKAAAHGDHDAYLEQLLGASLVAEATSQKEPG